MPELGQPPPKAAHGARIAQLWDVATSLRSGFPLGARIRDAATAPGRLRLRGGSLFRPASCTASLAETERQSLRQYLREQVEPAEVWQALKARPRVGQPDGRRQRRAPARDRALRGARPGPRGGDAEGERRQQRLAQLLEQQARVAAKGQLADLLEELTQRLCSALMLPQARAPARGRASSATHRRRARPARRIRAARAPAPQRRQRVWRGKRSGRAGRVGHRAAPGMRERRASHARIRRPSPRGRPGRRWRRSPHAASRGPGRSSPPS
jgi:hypothetical protein